MAPVLFGNLTHSFSGVGSVTPILLFRPGRLSTGLVIRGREKSEKSPLGYSRIRTSKHAKCTMTAKGWISACDLRPAYAMPERHAVYRMSGRGRDRTCFEVRLGLLTS